MKHIKTFVFSTLTILTIGITSLAAQSSPARPALGIQIGQPSGLSLLVPSQKFDIDVLLAWDLDDFFYANVHGLLRKSLSSETSLSLFYGPGIYAGFRDRGRSEDDLFLGLSGTIGLSIHIENFEIYARITPRLRLIESTEGDIGGGIGFRYFL